MENSSNTERSLVLQYLTLRRAIGFLGTVVLPIMIPFGGRILFQIDYQSSLSSYYYTVMGDVFVGTLCAIGVFLFSYRGHDRKDDIAGNLACVFVVGVALFPIWPRDSDSSRVTIIGILHIAFAVSFLITLAYFSLCLFTKTDTKEGAPLPPRKLHRNRIYKFCGYTILICIFLISIEVSVPKLKNLLEPYHPILWLEAMAILFFGISWLTKGETILRDKP